MSGGAAMTRKREEVWADTAAFRALERINDSGEMWTDRCVGIVARALRSAYRRGQRDEREACAELCREYSVICPGEPSRYFTQIVEDIRAEQREAIAAELRRAAKEVKRTTGSDDFADGYRCAADIAEKFGEDKP